MDEELVALQEVGPRRELYLRAVDPRYSKSGGPTSLPSLAQTTTSNPRPDTHLATASLDMDRTAVVQGLIGSRSSPLCQGALVTFDSLLGDQEARVKFTQYQRPFRGAARQTRSYLSPVLIDSQHCPITGANVQLGALARDKRRRILVGHRLRLSFGKRVALSKQSKVRLTSPSLTTIVLPEDPFADDPRIHGCFAAEQRASRKGTQAAILDNLLITKFPSSRMRHWSSITCWSECVAKKQC